MRFYEEIFHEHYPDGKIVCGLQFGDDTYAVLASPAKNVPPYFRIAGKEHFLFSSVGLRGEIGRQADMNERFFSGVTPFMRENGWRLWRAHEQEAFREMFLLDEFSVDGMDEKAYIEIFLKSVAGRLVQKARDFRALLSGKGDDEARSIVPDEIGDELMQCWLSTPCDSIEAQKGRQALLRFSEKADIETLLDLPVPISFDNFLSLFAPFSKMIMEALGGEAKKTVIAMLPQGYEIFSEGDIITGVVKKA